MNSPSHYFFLICTLFAAQFNTVKAEPLFLDAATTPLATQDDYFRMGTSRNPAGLELTVNSRSLLLNGQPWLPVMGEFQYSRYPESEWRDELLKMKAGGIDVVSTYVFWIHHEEIEGQFDWKGRKNLREFVRLCGEVGLSAVVRCGPWCHGEVRNGGLPDWLIANAFPARTDDPAYLAKVRALYSEIAGQLKGQLWKEGGPVIGIQFDNEYAGPAEHLLSLKKIAQDVGLDTPLYTKTGWPTLKTKMPPGEMLPLYGGYAEGFWNHALTPMPSKYWFQFVFSTIRLDSEIGTDQLGKQEAKDDEDSVKYPYLTCEIGGGMMSSYHRRILMPPSDIEAVTLVKIGSGSNLPGYYMYHGGTNPEGQLSTLQESQDTNYPNDLPVKNYDFQAPLGEYGQIRPHYHWLRRLHLFLHDYGTSLTAMTARMPEVRPTDSQDANTVRWSVRSNGASGFLFVNNEQRLLPMPAKPGVQFAVKLAGGEVRIPEEPLTVPADGGFFWPFNFDLGAANLVYATAQPVCQVEEQGIRYVVFAETAGVAADFVFSGAGVKVESATGKVSSSNDRTRVQQVKPGTEAGIHIKTKDGKETVIILLDEETSLSCWKETWKGRERIFLTKAGLVLDKDTLRLRATAPDDLSVAMLPAPASILVDGTQLKAKPDGVFQHFSAATKPISAVKVEAQSMQEAAPAREVTNGKKGVAGAPTDADFENAAIWKIIIPKGAALDANPILRVRYVGDVARFYFDGKLVTDDFYNGNVFEIGLKQFGADLFKKELLLKILPLRKDAPIYLAKQARPDFGKADSAVSLQSAEVISEQEMQIEAE